MTAKPVLEESPSHSEQDIFSVLNLLQLRRNSLKMSASLKMTANLKPTPIEEKLTEDVSNLKMTAAFFKYLKCGK